MHVYQRFFMIIIGLCGGSGAGKGTVSGLFLKHGIPSIDADAVYRELTSRGSKLLHTLSNEFGAEILSENGELDRKKLSSIVFSSPEKRRVLNSITHAEILRETDKRMIEYQKNGAPAVIFDAPLLFESGFDKRCDVIIAVTAPLEIRIERLTERDGISAEMASKRISSQLSDDYLIERSTFVITNDGDISNLQEQTDKIVNKILK